MLWDARVWSFFMWVISTALFLCGFCTPYDMPGNKEVVPVAFGGSVDPGEDNYIGLWGPVPEALSGTMMAVRGLTCVSVVMMTASLIIYILLFKRNAVILQVLACVVNVIAGLMSIIAVGVYRGASDQLGEGFYFVASSGGLCVINGIVLVLIPWMEYQVPTWKSSSSSPETVPLQHVKTTDMTDDNANA